MKVQTSIVQAGEKFAVVPQAECFLYNDALWERITNGTAGKPRAVRLADGYVQAFSGDERVVRAPNVSIVPG